MTPAQIGEAIGLLARYRRLKLTEPAGLEIVFIRSRLLGLGVILDD